MICNTIIVISEVFHHDSTYLLWHIYYRAFTICQIIPRGQGFCRSRKEFPIPLWNALCCSLTKPNRTCPTSAIVYIQTSTVWKNWQFKVFIACPHFFLILINRIISMFEFEICSKFVQVPYNSILLCFVYDFN